MNYNSLTIIALALCLCIVAAPVAAEGMWNGDNWVDSHHNDKCTKVVFNPQTGNTNCYNENVGSLADIKADPNTYSGRADVIIKVHSNALNPVMYLANNLTPNITETISVNNDGLNTIPNLAPGEFILTLDRYDLPDEVVHFTIAAGQQEPTRVVFDGQGYSATAVQTCQREVFEASYCGVTIPAVTHVVHHDAYYTVVEAQKIWGYFGCYYNGNADKSMHNPYDFVVDGQKYDFQYHGRYIYTFHSAYDETVIDTPAVLGGCADVTQNVKDALSQGYTMFLFDNSAPHHGIYDITTTTLLSSVDDPAEGIVKDVSISYRTCSGIEQIISGKEYQAIGLN